MDDRDGGRVVLLSTLVAIVVVILVAVSVGATVAWVGVASVVRPAPTFPAVALAPAAARPTPTLPVPTRARPTGAVAAAPTSTPPIVADAPTRAATPTEPARTSAPTEQAVVIAPTEPARTSAPTAPDVANAPAAPVRTSAPTEQAVVIAPTEPARTSAPTAPDVANAPAAPAAPAAAQDAPVATSQPSLAEPLLVDTFNERGGWPERVSERGSASYQGGRFRLALSGQPSIGVTTPLDASDYDLGVDITPARGSAGLVFLSRQPTTFYRVMIASDGAWTLEEVTGNNTRAIQHGSTAIRAGGNASNRVRVERRERTIDIWVNDQHITQWTAPAGDLRGQYGVVLQAPDARGEASFDNLTVATVPSS